MCAFKQTLVAFPQYMLSSTACFPDLVTCVYVLMILLGSRVLINIHVVVCYTCSFQQPALVCTAINPESGIMSDKKLT